MSAELTSDAALSSDLPPRTWRGWWLAWPKWFRIGAWAILGVILLHVVLAVRVVVGLIETDEISKLRSRDRSQIHYVWESDQALDGSSLTEAQYGMYSLLVAGLRGRTCANVDGITLHDADDCDLETIGRYFPNLQVLNLWDADISAHGLAKLQDCHHLTELSLGDTDVDDQMAELLVTLPRLAKLDLRGTLITDAVIPVLRRMETLETVLVGSTDVTREAVLGWRTAEGFKLPNVWMDHRQELPEFLRTSIRWSDGTQDDRFATHGANGSRATLDFEGPLEDENNKVRKTCLLLNRPGRTSFSSETLSPAIPDGKYQITLNLFGNVSKPMIIEIDRDNATTQFLEFQMPVTKQQALDQSEQP